MTKSNSKNIPVFWGHGKADPVVQYECESITSLAVREADLQMERDL
jgi:predicted esterase